MTTQAQMESNRRNAQRSTGPRTARGKAVARQNALKDGLTGGGIVLTTGDAEKVERDLPAYLTLYRPTNDVEYWDVRRVVIDSVRADRCYEEENAIRRDEVMRAMMSWVEDREADAAKLASRLEQRPDLIALQLKRTMWGCYWLLDRWEILLATLDEGQDWNESECSLALDLLGVAPILRKPGFTPIDPRGSDDPIEHRSRLVVQIIDELSERINGPLATLDEEHQQLVLNDMVSIDNARLARIRRYEQSALRRVARARRNLEKRDADPMANLPPAPQTMAVSAPAAPQSAVASRPAPSRSMTEPSDREDSSHRIDPGSSMDRQTLRQTYRAEAPTRESALLEAASRTGQDPRDESYYFNIDGDMTFDE